MPQNLTEKHQFNDGQNKHDYLLLCVVLEVGGTSRVLGGNTCKAEKLKVSASCLPCFDKNV